MASTINSVQVLLYALNQNLRMSYLLLKKKDFYKNRRALWRLFKETVKPEDYGDPLETISRGLKEELNFKGKLRKLDELRDYEISMEDRKSFEKRIINKIKIYAAEFDSHARLKPDKKEILDYRWFYSNSAKNVLNRSGEGGVVSLFEKNLLDKIRNNLKPQIVSHHPQNHEFEKLSYVQNAKLV